MRLRGLEKYSKEEIADAFVLTEKLSKREQIIARKELADARKKRQQEMTEKEKPKSTE